MEAKLDKPSTVNWFCDRTSDWFTLWLDLKLLVPYAADCFADNIILKYDPETRTTRNNDGVQIRIPGFGGTATVETLGQDFVTNRLGSYFRDIAESLVSIGYQRGVNLHGAPYDFRKAANEHFDYFQRVVDLIQDAYTRNGNKSVIIITHSMGSTMALYLLNHQSKAWKDKYIRAFISLGGPWIGTVQALKTFAIGDNFNNPLVPASVFVTEQRSDASLAWLMPNMNYWNANENFIEAPNINITKDNFEMFYNMLGSTDGLNLWYDTKDLTQEMVAPEVELFCLYSTGVPTVEKLRY